MNKIKELTAHLRLMVQRGDIVLKRKADDFDTALNQIDIASEAKNSNAITMNTGQLIQIFEESANWSIKGQQCMPKLRFIEVVSKLLSATNNAESMAVDDDAIKAMAEKEYPNRLGGPHDINFAIAQPAYIKGAKDMLKIKGSPDGWISVEDRLPENIGNYICFTNDEQCMVCHINANGWWSIVPNAQYYGDMGEKVVINSKEVDREVILWMDIQHHYESAYAITKNHQKNK